MLLPLKVQRWLGIFFLLVLLNGCNKKEEKSSPRSIYDLKMFAEVAKQAVDNENDFMKFRQNPYFNLLWDNATKEEGEVWLSKIALQSPETLGNIQLFRQIDKVGSPRLYEYPQLGKISPNVLKQMAIISDLKRRLKDFSRLKIVIIGAQYGSLCYSLNVECKEAVMTLVDLPEQLSLAKKCLKTWGIKNVSFLTPEELPRKVNCDLVISDLSFSEFNHTYQQLFFDRIFSFAYSGYLIGHIFPKHFGVVAYSFEELKLRLNKMDRISELELIEPVPDAEEYFIFWKRDHFLK